MSLPTATTAEDYSKRYYRHCLGSDEPYSWDSEGWRSWFIGVAERLRRVLSPFSTVLDVGCAHGLLVQALVAEGIDARGFDVSATAIADAHVDVRDRVHVASATDPIEGRYDLVTCIEVLEHMTPIEVEDAIDNLCRVTNRIVLSSTPADFDEPTHVNVHPLADWVAAFATRGFFRRLDVDLGFLTPWAVYFERAELSARDVVHRYETHLYPLVLEVNAKRQGLLEAHRQLARVDGGADATELRHELMLLRDHAIGREAAAASARLEVERLELELVAARHDLAAIRNSERWKVGGAIVAPASVVKRRGKR